MKNLKEMDFSEKVTWACGTVLIGIGDGNFRSSMSSVMVVINQDAFERGRQLGRKDVLDARPKRRKAKK